MITVIIPTYNEAGNIGILLRYLNENGKKGISEIIVSDGGSTDETVYVAEKEGAKIVQPNKKGRAAQMNHAAAEATAPVLYFLHADTFPPKDFAKQILAAYDKGYKSGCFRLQFDYRHWFLQAHSWFTRFDVNYFRFGDQSLFVSKEIFQQIGGFNEKLIVMEDQEIISRLRKRTNFRVMNDSVITSARKYRENGIYKTQAVYYLVYFLYKTGFSQQRLVNTYRRFIRQTKP